MQWKISNAEMLRCNLDKKMDKWVDAIIKFLYFFTKLSVEKVDSPHMPQWPANKLEGL